MFRSGQVRLGCQQDSEGIKQALFVGKVLHIVNILLKYLLYIVNIFLTFLIPLMLAYALKLVNLQQKIP